MERSSALPQSKGPGGWNGKEKHMEQAFAEMKSITLPRAGGTEQQSVFVCVNGRTFQVPRGKAVEVPEPVYEVLENARRQLEAARKLEDELAAG